VEGILKESDLSRPVAAYFESMSYTVNAEVKGCDLVARSGDYMIAIEIKKGFTTKLLFQAMDRQNFADEVYIAIAKPKRITSDTAKIKRLAKELNLGYLYVNLGSVPYVDVLYEPQKREKLRKNKRKELAMKEAKGRTFELNMGGSSKTKIATVYRERCMAIAAALFSAGRDLSPLELSEIFRLDFDCGPYLRRNYYGWFNKPSKGRYILCENVSNEIASSGFSKIYNLYLDRFSKSFPQKSCEGH